MRLGKKRVAGLLVLVGIVAFSAALVAGYSRLGRTQQNAGLKAVFVPARFSLAEARLVEQTLTDRFPAAAQGFRLSKHAAVGMTCVTCHQEIEVAPPTAGGIRFVQTEVPPERCAECHEKQYAGFRQSRHYKAVHVFGEVIRYKALAGYAAMQRQGCNRCHEPIAQTCSACHPAHVFARPRPPVSEFGGCERCHLGPDHHQLEAYTSSVHYQVAKARGDGIPNCVYCHTEDGNNHAIFRIKGAPDHGRARLMAKCTRCHERAFAEQAFEEIDAVKRETNAILDAAREIIRDLYRDGILKPVPGSLVDQEGLPILNPNVTAYDQHVHPIEGLMFHMFKYDAVATIAGAQHFSAVRTHWYGHARLMETYNRIRQWATELRFLHTLGRELGLKPPQIEPYRYSGETGHEFDEAWRDPAAYRRRLEKFYSEVNE